MNDNLDTEEIVTCPPPPPAPPPLRHTAQPLPPLTVIGTVEILHVTCNFLQKKMIIAEVLY